MNEIKVSVCMITYNHEAYIAEAIESVLMQQTDFPVELVIGEDCSTDSTRNIVREYGKRYPERIRLLLPEQNLGVISNFVAVLNACQGKYIAMLEGDDYWTNPYKLQKQVDFLEDHVHFSICFHKIMNLITENKPLQRTKTNYTKTIFEFQDLVFQNFIPTCSVMFRKGLISDFPEWFFKTIMTDWALHILNAEYGCIGLIDEIMAVHRSHPGGIWTSKHNIDKGLEMINFYLLLGENFGEKYKPIIRRGLSKEFILLSSIYADISNMEKSKCYLNKSILAKFPLEGWWTDQLAMIIRIYFPRIYGFIKLFSKNEKTFFYSHNKK